MDQLSGVRFAWPNLRVDDALMADIRSILESGDVTNGKWVGVFEKLAAEVIGVNEAVAVSSCTSGLILVLRSIREERGFHSVHLPSYTWCATAHAALWAGYEELVYHDVEPDEWTMVCGGTLPEGHVWLPVPTFGNPCRDGFPDEATVYDSAHALGSRLPSGDLVGGRGIAEVFSLSPTKVVSTMEGGLITTRDTDLAWSLRRLRDYGIQRSSGDVPYAGLNARMNEVSARIGVHHLRHLDEVVRRRRSIARSYRDALGQRVTFQSENGESCWKDVTILTDRRESVCERLDADGVGHKKYFSLPLHRQTATRQEVQLPTTDWLAGRCVSLPIYDAMRDVDIRYVCDSVTRGLGL